MVRREASLHLPEFHMSRNEIIFDIPEIFKTTRVELKIPEIKIRTTEEGKKDVKEGSEQLASAATTLATAQHSELIAHSYQQLLEQRNHIVAQRDPAISQMTDAIAQIRQAGLDPSAVPQEGGAKLNLLAQLEELEKSFATALAEIDSALQQLQASSIAESEA